MTLRSRSTLPVLALLAVTACGTSGPGGSPDPEGPCVPGRSYDCTCDDGRRGVGTCGVGGCSCSPAPHFRVEPAAVDFGEVAPGETRELAVRLYNPYSAAVSLRSVELLGAEPGVFAFAGEVPDGIEANGSTAITLRFAPVVPGTAAARLRVVTAEGVVAPVEVTVTGRAPGAWLACTPDEVFFDTVYVGGTAATAVVCTNVGLAGANDPARFPLSRLEVTGPRFSASWREAPPEAGLAPGASATIDVGFDGAEPGDYHGTLEVGGAVATVSIPLAGQVSDATPCEVEVVPEVLRMGLVEPDEAVTFEFAIRNHRADASCNVRDLGLCEGTDPSFSLPDGPRDLLVVPAGGEVRVRVRRAPGGAVCSIPEERGCVEFELEQANGHRTIPLVCVGPPDPSVFATPSDLDFGAVSPGCATRDREVILTNDSSIALHFDDAELNEGISDEFFIRSEPPTGLPLAPGASLAFTLAYRPEDAGADLGSVFVWFQELAAPLMVTLRGRGEPGTVQWDSFQQPPRPKVDFLAVIDNGTTMGPEAARLVSELGALPEFAIAQELDFHLAVTTTGLVAGGPGCPGGVSGGEDGRFFPVDGSRPRILDENTPHLRATWEANLGVGTCHEAPPQLFEAALRALTAPLSTSADDSRHPEPDDGNLGFWRQDAHLSVVAISDRADESPGTVNAYYNALQGLKGFRNTHLFNFHAITGPKTTGCSAEDGRAATAGDRLIQLVEKTDGGIFASICDDGWYEALTEFSGAAMSHSRSCFFLGNQPEDRNGNGTISDAEQELQVLVDGVLVPSTADGETIWWYAPDQIAVCFDPDHVPEPLSIVEIGYAVSCMTW